MSPTSSPASWGALQSSDKSARPEHIEKCQQRCRSSVTTSLVYRRARPSRWAYVENFLSNSPFFVNTARIFVILCTFRALIKLFGKQVMGEAAYFGFDSVLHPPPPTSHTKKNHPLFIVSLWTPVILAEPVGWVDFQEKKAAAELVKRPLWSNPES